MKTLLRRLQKTSCLLSSEETLRKCELFTLKTEVVIRGVWTIIGVIVSGVVFSTHDVSAGV